MATRTAVKNSRNSSNDKSLGKSVSFEFYAPFAGEVCIAGEFNNWDSSKAKLKRGADGHWKLVLNLKPGRYEYRFLVDGNWENDPKSTEFVPNNFGTWNCVIEVR